MLLVCTILNKGSLLHAEKLYIKCAKHNSMINDYSILYISLSGKLINLMKPSVHRSRHVLPCFNHCPGGGGGGGVHQMIKESSCGRLFINREAWGDLGALIKASHVPGGAVRPHGSSLCGERNAHEMKPSGPTWTWNNTRLFSWHTYSHTWLTHTHTHTCSHTHGTLWGRSNSSTSPQSIQAKQHLF